MSVPIQGGATPSVGTPEVILPALTYTPFERSGRTYDLSPDGRRFLILGTPVTVGNVPSGNRFEVVLNWAEELKPAP